MSKLARRVVEEIAKQSPLWQLRQDLARVSTPDEALDVAQRAARAKVIFETIGRSVEECNEFAEIYLQAYWKFGYLVDGIERGRPQKTLTDQHFPGKRNQRAYARKLRHAIQESDIPEYVRVATEELEPASIAGCLDWINPGRHGNLKGEYEWYTPKEIIEAARTVLGNIDLDPASCEAANEIVQAGSYFTEEQNGLEQPWQGRVFLNPPFAHPIVKYFADKLIASFEAREVPEAIWLSNACVDVGWWQQLATRGAVCFHYGRIKFYGPDGQLQPPTLGQTIVYLGENQQAFRDVFANFGVVLS